MKVLGFGDNVIDRFIDRRIDYPGGNCVNFAVFAHELSVPAGYLGAFGSDGHGQYMLAELDRIGIDVSRCVIRDGESGIAEVEVVDGERVFRGGNHGGVTTREPIILGDPELAYISEFDLIHSSVYSTSEEQIPKLAGLDILISYDLSSEMTYRSSPYLDELAPHLDLALLSCSGVTIDDTEALLRDIVRRGAGMALGTRGAEGAMLFDGSEMYSTPAVPLDARRGIADTMGCGDAFLAAFVVSLLRSGWRKTVHASAPAIVLGLAAGAAHAAEQCYVDGAFGHGRPFAAEQHKDDVDAVSR
ncbi:MAG: PfkB family carbohydrate kinase [Terrimesophilobacter sp.]